MVEMLMYKGFQAKKTSRHTSLDTSLDTSRQTSRQRCRIQREVRREVDGRSLQLTSRPKTPFYKGVSSDYGCM